MQRRNCCLNDGMYTHVLFSEHLTLDSNLILDGYLFSTTCEDFYQPQLIDSEFEFSFGCMLIGRLDFHSNPQLLNELRYLATTDQVELTERMLKALDAGNGTSANADSLFKTPNAANIGPFDDSKKLINLREKYRQIVTNEGLADQSQPSKRQRNGRSSEFDFFKFQREMISR